MGVAAVETTIVWQSHKGARISQSMGMDVIDCAMCGFRHIIPLPDPRVLEASYCEASRQDKNPPFLLRASEDEYWVEPAQNDCLEVFEQLLPSSHRRLLDIGPGSGSFLKAAKARSWRVLRVEPSRQAAIHARSQGLDVVEGFFNADTAPGLGRFDAIRLNDILERVPDPASLLIEARALLDANGILCVNVPNDFSPLQIAACTATTHKKWWGEPAHRLNYFDFDSLANLLERLDFRIVDQAASFPMELFLTHGRKLHN